MNKKQIANFVLVSALSKFKFEVKKGWKWLPLIHPSISVSVDGSKHIKFVFNSLLQENHFLFSA